MRRVGADPGAFAVTAGALVQCTLTSLCTSCCGMSRGMQGVIWVYFTILLPLMFNPYTSRGAAHTVLSVWLSFNILFNYAMCSRTDPGSPPDLFSSAESGEAGGSPTKRAAAGQMHSSGQHTMRWCRTCNNVKPPICHHCSVCNRCVLKMDHHCPWMNNCIGLRNYRYFFLFMMYLWLGCAYACAICYRAASDDPDLEPVRRMLLWLSRLVRGLDVETQQERLHQQPAVVLSRPLEVSERSAIVFSFLLALSVFLALSILLGWHVFLTATAETTIDFYAHRELARAARKEGRTWVNDFDMGIRRNWQETFDERGRLWWLTWALPRLALHRGTGMRFPSASAEAESERRQQRDRLRQRKAAPPPPRISEEQHSGVKGYDSAEE